VIADLDTLLIALYVELVDRIIPPVGTPPRPGPAAGGDRRRAGLSGGRPSAVALPPGTPLAAGRPSRVGHLFPRLLGQSEDNQRLKDAAPLMEAALGWLAEHTPGSVELLRLLDGTPVGCGQSTRTAQRSNLFGYAGYGYDSSHSRYDWGVKLMLICTADGTVTGFGLANPKLWGEREQTRQLLTHQAVNRPAAGTAVVTDKGLAGEDTEQVFADLGRTLIRPARKDEPTPRPSPTGCASASRRSSGP
jgi:hypothetical protein